MIIIYQIYIALFPVINDTSQSLHKLNYKKQKIAKQNKSLKLKSKGENVCFKGSFEK